MPNNKFAVYSLPDIKCVLKHNSVGTCILSNEGSGRVTVSYTNDLGSVTTTATGYVVINKLVAKNGAISIEIPTNSNADIFLRKWANYLKKAPTKEFALSTFSLTDPAAGRVMNFTGVFPQRMPDEGYDANSANRQYNLLFAEMTESKA